MKIEKMKVEVFVPLASCACTFAPFMEKVGRVTSKYKDLVEVQMKSIKSPEASKYGIHGMCVVVDGAVKLSESCEDKEIENTILRRKAEEQIKIS